NGTGVGGVSHQNTSGTLTWTNGEIANKTFNVAIIDNLLTNGNRTVNLVLTNLLGGASLGRSNALLTIIDNEFGPGLLAFATNNFLVNEGSLNAIITVVRTNGSLGPVSVTFSTADGTATNGVHYTGTSGVLGWLDNDPNPKTFTVALATDDLTTNSSRAFTVILSGPSGGATLTTPNPATVTNLDNDLGLQFVQTNLTVLENAGTITLTVIRPDALA